MSVRAVPTPATTPGTPPQPARLGNITGTLKILNHEMYSNYNSLQVSWNKQAGRFTYMANYTFGKALGIRGENGGGGNIGDPTNLKNNYGTLPNNRTHIFNLAYVYQFPNLNSENKLVKGVLNNWQVSGIGQYQSGCRPASGKRQQCRTSTTPPISRRVQHSGQDDCRRRCRQATRTYLAAPDVQLMPKVICDPRKNLGPNQYINGNCFQGFATPGQQGRLRLPNVDRSGIL